jgi:glutaredoxin-like protein NrdH
MPQATGSVSGDHDERHVVLYALSTCIWCRRTRRFLESNGVAFDFIYVDLIQGREREEALSEVRRWNPSVSFPTLVVDGSQCVVGAQQEKIKEVLGL